MAENKLGRKRIEGMSKNFALHGIRKDCGMNVPNPGFGGFSPKVGYSPAHIFKRRPANWLGVEAESIELTEPQPYEYDFQSPYHLLIAPERSLRLDGETAVDGLPKS